MYKFNHNPHDFEVGCQAMLDRGYSNQNVIMIKSFTPNKMFVEVFSKDDPNVTWRTMTYRLSPLTIQEHLKEKQKQW